jgi:heat shock protein HslJ
MKHPRLYRAPALLAAALLAGSAVAAPPGTGGTAAGHEATATPPADTPPAASPTPAPDTGTDAAALEATSWLLKSYRSGKTLVDIAAGSEPARFRFEDGRLAGRAGCNQLGGAYTLDGSKLSFKPNLASTMMACPEPLMKQEQAVGAALVRVAAWRRDGEQLELLDAAGRPQLRFLPLKAAPLVGQVWQLKGYNNGKQAIVSTLAGTEISLEFRDDGTLGGSDGCNRYMSGYTLEAEVLTIGPIATTRMACKGPAGAAEQARDYAAVLGTVHGYRIEGGELTLQSDEGKPAARYRVAAVPVIESAPAPETGETQATPATTTPPVQPMPAP